ncbi:DUF3592 domain-containing protein [Nakamurella sp.]|uniref:DUF3592 domain-containing protein n=1 Tax=Nakamurella sp. TaxID=1869182 RepID=UPI003B3A5607
MSTLADAPAPPRRNRLMIVVGAIFLAVGLILGTVFALIGTKDYSAYTARASATVVDVDVHTTRSNGTTRTSREYDVQFTADGRTYRIDHIDGVRTGGDLAAGDVVAVAFPPADPQSAVSAATVDGGARVLLIVGVGAGLLFGGLGALVLGLGLRRRPAAVLGGAGAVRPAGPVPADPGPADAIGRRWTFDEVVADLARRTAGTPYTVLRAGDAVTVRVDLADARWWALLQRQGLTKTYATTLTPAGAGRVARSDLLAEVEWAAGPDGRLVPRLTGHAAAVGGRVWAVGAEKAWALGPDGVSTVVDYRLDSGELHGLVRATLERAGWSTALDVQSRIGIWVAAVAAVGAVAAGIAVLVL